MADNPNNPNFDQAIEEAVNRVLGTSVKSAGPVSTPAAAPEPSAIDRLAKVLELQLAAQLAEQTAKYQSPGAPSGAPVSTYSEDDPISFLKASREDIEELRRTGKFQGAMEKTYQALGAYNRPFVKTKRTR